MAEKVFEKLDEQLNCGICLDTYTDPKLLQCFHTYCTKCLIKLVVRNRQEQPVITCPACRQVTPIPPNGVRGLHSAFQINEFIGIRDDLKMVKVLMISSQEPGVEGDVESQIKLLRKKSAPSMLVNNLNSIVRPAMSSSVVIYVLLKMASIMVIILIH